MTAAKPLPGFDERWAEVRGVRLRYEIGGDGPPVVLVHGLGGASTNWLHMAPALAARHRVLVPDLPGHGGSSPLPALPNLNPLADAVYALAAGEGLLPAPLVGHSLGAVVALRHALRYPGDTSGVVLAGAAGIRSSTRVAQVVLTVSTLVRPGRRLAPYGRRIAYSPLLRTLVFGGWGAADARALAPDAAEAFLAWSGHHTDVAATAAALVREDPRADLGGVHCPCLVLWGARDTQAPVADAFDYVRRLGAELRLIADCGHLLIGERPDACVEAVESFLATRLF